MIMTAITNNAMIQSTIPITDENTNGAVVKAASPSMLYLNNDRKD